MKLKTTYLTLAILVATIHTIGQTRLDTIKTALDSLAVQQPGLNETVELSINGTPLNEFIRGIALTHNLNVHVDEGLDKPVVNSFTNVPVKDLFAFLCKEYDMALEVSGMIISFSKYMPPKVKPPPAPLRIPKVSYNPGSDFLSIDFRKDTLYKVAVELTKKSNRNVVVDPSLENMLVSAFIINRPFEDALQKFGFANGLTITKGKGNFFMIEKNKSNKSASETMAELDAKDGLEKFSADSTGITIHAKNVVIHELISHVSKSLFIQHYMFSNPEEKVTLYLDNVSYEQFLGYVLDGTKYSFKLDEEVYLIGLNTSSKLKTTELVQLQNRTVEKLIEMIPKEMKAGVEIREFLELNALVITGGSAKVKHISDFISSVDQLVPLITIELLIVDVSNTSSLSTGVEAGLGEPPASSQGEVWPGLDVNLSTQGINDIIGNINGFGLINLGRVTPNFYLNIKALEENGALKTKSTPKLATLNGHEASLSIGKTEFYSEVTTNTFASPSVQTTNAIVWRSLNANFTIDLRPIVSGDNQVTLEISVQQSDFTARVSPQAPPGQVSRSFSSLVRVKDQETILLGGLEENSSDNTGRGVPLLSRVPVVKWLFSSRTKQRSKTKLAIFIKPTIQR